VALALWDSAATVDDAADTAGVEQDLALSHPELLARLHTAMAPRQIVISLADSADCPPAKTTTDRHRHPLPRRCGFT